MKKMIIVTLVSLVALVTRAQFTNAELQATGLTCAMCNNAINKALQGLPFISSVKSDIKNSSFRILFKTGEALNIDAMKKAVEDAGFSIGSLKLTGNFQDVKIQADQHVEIQNIAFHFLNGGEQVLSGEKTIQVVDKNFITMKKFRKMSALTGMSCMQTGKAASCCMKDGIPVDTRVYHVTI